MENEGRAFYNSFPYRVWERENEKYNSFPYRVWERENEKYNSFPYRVWERENEKMRNIIHSHTEYGNEKRENFLTFRFTNIALITESITVATQGIAMALPVNFRMV
jgi:hypothetical protein